jgi:mannitol-1-phosphate/altronate dehydrogenase
VDRRLNARRIAPVAAIDAQDAEAVAAAFARAEVASTAVGVNVLPQLAPLIAAGLRRRAAENPKPLNLLLGENALDAHTRLREALLQTLAPNEQPLLETCSAWCAASSGVKPSLNCLATRQACASIAIARSL